MANIFAWRRFGAAFAAFAVCALMGSVAVAAEFSGAGLAAGMVPGCSLPTLKADWIDQVAQREHRRVLPRDCVRAQDNPPVFSWVQATAPIRQGPYTLRVQRQDPLTLRWQDAQVSTSSQPRATLNLPLLKGYRYQWRVEYNESKVLSQWRQFEIDANALTAPPLQATAAYAHASTRAHPRLLAPGATWADMWERAQGSDLKAPAQALLKEAYRLTALRDGLGQGADASIKALASEPALRARADFSQEAAYNAHQSSVRTAAETAAQQLNTLALAYHLAPYGGLGDAQDSILASARVRLRALARWANGSTSHANADQSNRTIYLGLAVAFDLLFDRLTVRERDDVVQAIAQRVAKPVAELWAFDAMPYRSHEANTLMYTVRALALTAGEPGANAEAFTQTWAALSTLSSVWGEYDGGTGNGVTYGWNDFLAVPEAMYVLEVVCGADFSKRAWFRHAPDNLMALTPPGQVGPPAFGDSNEPRDFAAFAHHAVRLHAALVPRPATQWYWRQSSNRLQFDNLTYHLLALGLNRPAADPAPPPPNFVFADVGHAAFHTSMTDKQRSSVYFRSSRFGAWNHAHADQNSFVYYAQGTPLLISGGVYDYYGSPHHRQVTRATRFKNAITFDGGVGQGQDSASGEPAFSMNPYGTLLNAGETGPVVVATGDATPAYQSFDAAKQIWTPLLTRALRSIAFHKDERVLLIYDHLESATPRRWEWNLQALQSFKVDEPAEDESEQPLATHHHVVLPYATSAADVKKACISLHGAPTQFSQTNSFEPAAMPSGPYAAQSHGRFTQTTATPQARTVTVVRENCSTPLPNVEFSDSEPTTARVTFADGTTVRFKEAVVRVEK
jgi:hypothetical protein